MRLIDADALQKEYQKEHGKRLLLIDVAPTIDAVEVVRCKDCKYAEVSVSPITGLWCTRFGINDMAMEDDDYCSYGEREDR